MIDYTYSMKDEPEPPGLLDSDGSAGRAVVCSTLCSLRCLGSEQLFWGQLSGQRKRVAGTLQLSRSLLPELNLIPR